MLRLTGYIVYDLLRNRVVIGYSAFLFLATTMLFNLDSDSARGTASMLNIVLLIVPLVSLVFSTIHWYNAQEFNTLLMTQPLKRRTVLLSQYLGLSVALCTSVSLGIGLPLALFAALGVGFMLYVAAMLLTLAFVSLGVLASVMTRDKARGIGVALLLWFMFSLVYDGLVLMVLFYFKDYPLDTPTLVMTSLNPIDLARILVLLQLDLSAIMGYTGAVFQKYLGSSTGLIVSGSILLFWAIWPIMLAFRVIRKKDF